MIVLVKPVGLTAKKGNLATDVANVKKLLNGIPENLGGPRVKLQVNGKADATLDSAIRQFQKTWFGDSLADGLVDPGSQTLQFLNEHSAENLRVEWVDAQRATHVSARGDQKIFHFVTPKHGSTVTLTARISPDHAVSRASIAWEGAKAGADKLVATLPAYPERKQVVRIKKTDGTVLQEIRVWVVWCTILPEKAQTTGVVAEQSDDKKDLEITAPWTFLHQIHPASIAYENDRPNLKGKSTVTVSPGVTDIKGGLLSNGANSIWDASRQVMIKMLDPRGLKPQSKDRLSYPSDEVEGNDDTHNGDEINDPTSNRSVRRLVNGKWVVTNLQGRLLSRDIPLFFMEHARGANGDTIERRLHFREFTRIELGGKWQRISDYFEWRFHARMKKVNGKWQDDNSTTDLDNVGFDAP